MHKNHSKTSIQKNQKIPEQASIYLIYLFGILHDPNKEPKLARDMLLGAFPQKWNGRATCSSLVTPRHVWATFFGICKTMPYVLDKPQKNPTKLQIHHNLKKSRHIYVCIPHYLCLTRDQQGKTYTYIHIHIYIYMYIYI